MKKLNKYICFGLLLNGVFLLGNGSGLMPEFIRGLCFASGLSLMFFGIYSENHDVSKLKNHKKEILSKFLLR